MMMWNPNGENISALPYSTHSAIKVLMLLPYMSGNIKLCPQFSSCSHFSAIGKSPRIKINPSTGGPVCPN